MGHDVQGPSTGGVKFKTGIVSAVDASTGSVKVSFGDIGLVSTWLTVCYPKTGQDKTYWLPDEGDQVRCIMDEHLEDGAVLGEVYSDGDAVPWTSADQFGVKFRDGGSMVYDRSSGNMTVIAMGELNATSTGDATFTAPEVIVNGNLRVKGQSSFEGGIGGAGGAGTPIPGTVRAQDDVIGQNVSLTGHEHRDSIGGTTDKPIPSV